MGTLVVGVPGSGKSYLAVNKIFTSAFNDKKLEFIYSNIEGLKIDYLNQTLQDQNKKCRIVHLDMDELKHHISSMWDIMHTNKGTDKELIEYCQEHDIYNAHFYIDEAHNHFMAQNKKLVWWFSYVRHMNQDYTLLTQNKDLINAKYRGFPEYFTRVKPPSHRLLAKKMSYTDYSSFAMQDKHKIKNYSITMSDEIFNLYHSGDTIKPKLFIMKMIISAIFVLLLFGSVMYYFTQNKYSEIEETREEHNISSPGAIDDLTFSPSAAPGEYKSTARNYRIYCDDSFCDFYKGRARAQYPYQYFIAVVGMIDAKILYQRVMYVYKGSTSNDVEMYVRIDNESAEEYFPDFYNLRDNAAEAEAITSIVPEDVM